MNLFYLAIKILILPILGIPFLIFNFLAIMFSNAMGYKVEIKAFDHQRMLQRHPILQFNGFVDTFASLGIWSALVLGIYYSVNYGVLFVITMIIGVPLLIILYAYWLSILKPISKISGSGIRWTLYIVVPIIPFMVLYYLGQR